MHVKLAAISFDFGKLMAIDLIKKTIEKDFFCTKKIIKIWLGVKRPKKWKKPKEKWNIQRKNKILAGMLRQIHRRCCALNSQLCEFTEKNRWTQRPINQSQTCHGKLDCKCQ